MCLKLFGRVIFIHHYTVQQKRAKCQNCVSFENITKQNKYHNLILIVVETDGIKEFFNVINFKTSELVRDTYLLRS